ncbi:hypothetical protein [Sphingobacterium sp. BIGb0165]|uniref:hypothetical protein n=1 Tax=Sphingobacterium sp. BIGb0165 TaxID=2940615 RepID=UPI002167402E|nr:hypothetical protein [Sphingobacterium sp. BIGb0165]MCS4224181.1 hypothetical protein [Sphingobacterium sp. BIGb0165]
MRIWLLNHSVNVIVKYDELSIYINKGVEYVGDHQGRLSSTLGSLQCLHQTMVEQ